MDENKENFTTNYIVLSEVGRRVKVVMRSGSEGRGYVRTFQSFKQSPQLDKYNVKKGVR